MVFAHVVPQKGLAHEHSAQELARVIRKLGSCEVFLRAMTSLL